MYRNSGALLVVSCWTRDMGMSWENLVSPLNQNAYVFNISVLVSVYSSGLDI